MNKRKKPKFDLRPLSDFSGSGESVEIIIMVAIMNQTTPRATTDQMLVAEKIDSMAILKNSISIYYARCGGEMQELWRAMKNEPACAGRKEKMKKISYN